MKTTTAMESATAMETTMEPAVTMDAAVEAPGNDYWPISSIIIRIRIIVRVIVGRIPIIRYDVHARRWRRDERGFCRCGSLCPWRGCHRRARLHYSLTLLQHRTHHPIRNAL